MKVFEFEIGYFQKIENLERLEFTIINLQTLGSSKKMSSVPIVSTALDELPAFCTSQMEENRQLFDLVLLHFEIIRIILLLQLTCVANLFAPNLIHFFYSVVDASRTWRRWLAIGKVLISTRVMKPSQISWKMFVWNFLAPEYDHFIWKDLWYWSIVQWQNQFLQWLLVKLVKLEITTDSLSMQSMRSLPRIAGKWEQLDDLAHKTLNSYLPLVLTKITEEYKQPTQKIDLLTVDLEDYFNFSGTIELQLFYDANAYGYSLRILNRGDRLLLTCPTSIVRRNCSADHRINCNCRHSTKILCNVDRGDRGDQSDSVLFKNLVFLQSLWEKIMQKAVPSNSVVSARGGLDVWVQSEIPWMNSMTEEFQTSTFVVSDILFTPEMHYYASTYLQFVGVE